MINETVWRIKIPNGVAAPLCAGDKDVKFYIVSNCIGTSQSTASQVVIRDSFFVFTNCTGGFRAVAAKQDMNESGEANASNQPISTWNDLTEANCSFETTTSDD
ncbi:unnamed protein product [Rodentolepis nana]|uniref:Fimbrial protein n=1 Tax=Rodentolepis nana TaxID=102285 RepID=A0A0R3T241_RODNA|nr:unnamed protein product [Rodentolepis nana]